MSLLPMECSDPGLVALLRPALYTTDTPVILSIKQGKKV